MWMEGWQSTLLLAAGLAGLFSVATTAAADSDDNRISSNEQATFANTQKNQISGDVLSETEANSVNSLRSKRQFEDSLEANRISENAVNTLGAPDEDFDYNNELPLLPQVKRFYTRSRPTKSEGYKRGPGFRSWGGKRGNKFSSWGGKRSEDVTAEPEKGEAEFPMLFEQFQKRSKSIFGGKRRPFQSWGGKRGYLTNSYGNPIFLRQDALRKLLSWEGKRKFSSWGGKRSLDDLDHFEEKRKKPSFRSWGGKRAEEDGEEDVVVFDE